MINLLQMTSNTDIMLSAIFLFITAAVVLAAWLDKDYRFGVIG